MDFHVSLGRRGHWSRDVYLQLRGAILDGRLRAGDALPATRTLAARLDVSRNTVMHAFERLIAEGFLEAKAGAGTYVRATAPITRRARPAALIPIARWRSISDTHDFDIDEAARWIQNRGGDGPQTVLGKLYTTDPRVRAQLLEQLKQRDLLEPFLDRLSWRETKELHDSLGLGLGAIKTDLQNHFIGRHGYGDSLATEWETHENSLHHHIGRIPGIGGKLNWLINTVSYGFTTPYGTERDAWTNGDISKSRYIKLGQENVGLTMVMVALQEATNGLGDKALEASTAARGLEPTAMRGWRSRAGPMPSLRRRST